MMNGPTKPPDITRSVGTRSAAMVIKKWLKVLATIFLSNFVYMSSPILLAADCFLKIHKVVNVFQTSEEKILH